MKKIIDNQNPKELLESLTKSQQKTSVKTDLPIHWITELFKIFQARYFAKWTSAIDGIEERAVKEWASELKGLTGEQLKNGLDNWKGEWPPTVIEFKKCCLSEIHDKYNTAAYRIYEPDRLLPQLKASKKHAAEYRRRLQDCINKGE